MTKPKKIEKKTIRMGEFFSGPGGFALGAQWASKRKPITIQHKWAVEMDADSCQTYAHNVLKAKVDTAQMPSQIMCRRVETVRIKKLPGIDLFAFGFPCNDFSQVGKKAGTRGKFGPLYEWGAKVIDLKKPKVFVAENVGGLRSANDGKALEKILDRLSNAGPGYTLYVHYYKFELYGVPQRRHRIVIVGVKGKNNSDSGYQIPRPIPKKAPTASQALRGIHPGDTDFPNNEEPRFSEQVRRRLEYIKPGENAWNSDIKTPELRLNVKGARLSNIYRRLKPNEPSYTVTGSGGGGTHVYHWKEPRPLNNRERAALQSFPKDYLFFGNLNSVRKQIGMAVPPRAAERIFDSIFRTVFLGKKLKGSIMPSIGKILPR